MWRFIHLVSNSFLSFFFFILWSWVRFLDCVFIFIGLLGVFSSLCSCSIMHSLPLNSLSPFSDSVSLSLFSFPSLSSFPPPSPLSDLIRSYVYIYMHRRNLSHKVAWSLPPRRWMVSPYGNKWIKLNCSLICLLVCSPLSLSFSLSSPSLFLCRSSSAFLLSLVCVALSLLAVVLLFQINKYEINMHASHKNLPTYLKCPPAFFPHSCFPPRRLSLLLFFFSFSRPSSLFSPPPLTRTTTITHTKIWKYLFY